LEEQMEFVKEIIIKMEDGTTRVFNKGAFITIKEMTEEFNEVDHYYCVENNDEMNEELNEIIFKAPYIFKQDKSKVLFLVKRERDREEVK